MSILSNIEKPSLIVIVRDGGGVFCARHVKDEQHIYRETLKKIDAMIARLDAKTRADCEKIIATLGKPTYNDITHIDCGWSAGNVNGAAKAMGCDLDQLERLWLVVAQDILPDSKELRRLIVNQASAFLHNFIQNNNFFPHAPSTSNGMAAPLAKIAYGLAVHAFGYRNAADSALSNPRFLESITRLGRSLTADFAAADKLIDNKGWERHLHPLGFYDKTLRESPNGIIYGAHWVEKGQPYYMGYLPRHLLSSEYKDGLLLGGHNISHGEALEAVTTIPFIFKPHKIAEGLHLKDMVLADGPHNFISWLTTTCPLNPKYKSIKVIYIGSGNRHSGFNAEELIENGAFQNWGSLAAGARNGSRRAAFATIRRTLAQFNGHYGAEQDLHILDIPDSGRNFLDASPENIRRIMDEDGEESQRLNADIFDKITTMLAKNYLTEIRFEQAMHLAHQQMIDAQRIGPIRWEILPPSSPPELSRFDINNEMGPYASIP